MCIFICKHTGTLGSRCCSPWKSAPSSRHQRSLSEPLFAPGQRGEHGDGVEVIDCDGDGNGDSDGDSDGDGRRIFKYQNIFTVDTNILSPNLSLHLIMPAIRCRDNEVVDGSSNVRSFQ